MVNAPYAISEYLWLISDYSRGYSVSIIIGDGEVFGWGVLVQMFRDIKRVFSFFTYSNGGMLCAMGVSTSLDEA